MQNMSLDKSWIVNQILFFLPWKWWTNSFCKYLIVFVSSLLTILLFLVNKLQLCKLLHHVMFPPTPSLELVRPRRKMTDEFPPTNILFRKIFKHDISYLNLFRRRHSFGMRMSSKPSILCSDFHLGLHKLLSGIKEESINVTYIYQFC